MRNLFGNRLPRGTRSAKSDTSSFPHPPSLSASLLANVAPSAAGVCMDKQMQKYHSLPVWQGEVHHVLACAVRSLKSVCLLKVHSYVCDVGTFSYVATTSTPRTAAEWYVHAAAWDGHILAFAYVGGMHCLVPRLIFACFWRGSGNNVMPTVADWLCVPGWFMPMVGFWGWNSQKSGYVVNLLQNWLACKRATAVIRFLN